MQPWKTRDRRIVLDSGKWLKVENHTVELPDGAIIEDWGWVITPDFVIVIAITDDDRWLCFRQTKYAVDGLSLAPVGGYIEPGEDPLEAAKRELLEETGYAAPDWVSLGHYVVDGNRGAGTANLFLARSAHKIAEPNADDLEEQELLFLTRAEVMTALDAAEFRVVPWTAAVALALLKTGSQ